MNSVLTHKAIAKGLHGCLAVMLAFGWMAPSWGADRPAWVDRPPKGGDYVYFVGTSSPSINERVGRQESVKDGLRQLAESFGVTASVYFQGNNRTAFRQANDQIVSYSDKVEIKGLEVENTYTEERNGLLTVFTLLRLPRPAYEDEGRRLAHASAGRVDLAAALARLTGELASFARGDQADRAYHVGEVRVDWPHEGPDPLAGAVREALVNALAAAKIGVALAEAEPAAGGIQATLGLNDQRSLVVSLSLSLGDRVVWASQPAEVDPVRLPPHLQAHVASLVRLESVSRVDGLFVGATPLTFRLEIVGANKHQYENVFKVLSGKNAFRDVSKTYYKAGFGKLELQALGDRDVGVESISSTLEECGLMLIDQTDNGLVFQQR